VRALYDDARAYRPRDPAAGPQYLELSLRAGGSQPDPLWPRGIKGTGAQAIEAIVAAREAGGPFRDLFDFCRRIDKRHVNRRAVEALVKAGAFDAIERHRAMLFASVGIALTEAEKAERDAAQVSLFGRPARGRRADTRGSP
jgi:DNA polymerase III alpha subunit